MGLSPRPTIHSVQVNMLIYISPEVGCQISWVTITDDPITLYGSLTSLGGMPMTNGGPLSIASSPHSTCAVCTNPGRGHGGLLSYYSSIISWGGVVGESILVVIVGQPSPHTTDRDPLGWPHYFSCSCGWDWDLMEWTPSAWVSSPLSNRMVP